MHDLLNVALVLWLLPCALQDYRTRHISNWLTVPAFLAAWPMALWLGGSERLVFTSAVFLGCWFAWQMKGMGAADGKIATALGAILPQAMAISGVLLMLAFLVLRLRRQPETTVPAAVAFFAGSVVGSIGVWFTPFW
jgi:Flp pilus assembly protein protease CpaA